MKFKSLASFVLLSVCILIGFSQNVFGRRQQRPPPTTATGTPNIDVYLSQVLAILNEEAAILQRRFVTGVDISVAGATTLTPALLGAEGGGPNPISRQSRAINLLSAIIAAGGSTVSLQAILQSLPNNIRALGFMCPFNQALACSNSPYRTADGTCNNLVNPLRGSTNTPLNRLLNPIYEAGPIIISSSIARQTLPRSTGVNGRPLPSPRAVSVRVHTAHPAITAADQAVIYTTFGQFLAHDITNTPMYTGTAGALLSCCSVVDFPADRCVQIPIAADDPFYRTTGQTCMGFTRSVEATDIDCIKGVRQQLNVVTAFLDVSGIYGETQAKQSDLREHVGGRLQTSFGDQFPMHAHPNQLATDLGVNLFKAGDPKVNEWTGLTGVTLAFLREHNRIAGQLAIVNPSWNDGKLFQEARRIVIAMQQDIVYSDYLPITIGPALMAQYGLAPKLTGYTTDYNPAVDPSVLNVYATAAGRFGHSMIIGVHGTMDTSCAALSKVLQLRELFFRSNYYLLNEQPFMRNHVCSAGRPFGARISEDLTNHLFETQPGNGLDLAALNIQRGRDHGLPSYTEFRRQFAGLGQGLVDHPPEVAAALQSVYDNIEDVDVWTGGISENPVAGGVVGPLFGNVLATQFQRLKTGDRYWYETAQQPRPFTTSQLNEIRSKSSLSKILCASLEITQIQLNAFLIANDASNPRVPCSAFADFNWNLWRE